MQDKYRILLVDDEPDILEFIGYNLVKEGYTVEKATNGEEALLKAKTFLPHLIILDIMMPGIDGIETCEKLRLMPSMSGTMIAFLTARSEDYSQVAGLESGADDYITKPIKIKVLLSRIKALLRRPVIHNTGITENKNIKNDKLIRVDRDRFIVIYKGKDVSLPRKEFELLSLLLSCPGKVFNREDIYSAVWGNDIIVGDRTIDVHIRKLREKFGNKIIKTIKGVGYKYVEHT